jgi:DNA-packaging protein gp3
MAGGRPATWTDPIEFSQWVDEYFNTSKSPTWSGLAFYLGFESRQSLEDYKKKPEFSYPIKRALLRIEEKYEEAMMKQPAGAIFALKNFGWKDKQEVEQTGGISIKYEKPGDYIYPSQDQSNSGIPESI